MSAGSCAAISRAPGSVVTHFMLLAASVMSPSSNPYFYMVLLQGPSQACGLDACPAHAALAEFQTRYASAMVNEAYKR